MLLVYTGAVGRCLSHYYKNWHQVSRDWSQRQCRATGWSSNAVTLLTRRSVKEVAMTRLTYTTDTYTKQLKTSSPTCALVTVTNQKLLPGWYHQDWCCVSQVNHDMSTVRGSNDKRLTIEGTNEAVPVSVSLSSLLPLGTILCSTVLLHLYPG